MVTNEHIPIRYSQTEVAAMMAQMQARIAELEQQLGEPSNSRHNK